MLDAGYSTFKHILDVDKAKYDGDSQYEIDDNYGEDEFQQQIDEAITRSDVARAARGPTEADNEEDDDDEPEDDDEPDGEED